MAKTRISLFDDNITLSYDEHTASRREESRMQSGQSVEDWLGSDDFEDEVSPKSFDDLLEEWYGEDADSVFYEALEELCRSLGIEL
ncbi:MAG: hypothetical protein KDD69_19505 [Bdellovibrionales bacterium]|nr:hypothetical protein [Bdellovibrionales bacterium]